MPYLNQILTPERTVCSVPGLSKKRLFETIAKIVSTDQLSLPYDDVLNRLIAREKLGSTGIGKGIAIPHCRVTNCSVPIGTLVTLEEPIPFDAPDDLPVDLLFILLVPEEAHQQHLDILANVARLLSQDDFCSELRAADDNRTLYDVACSREG
jgi:PTS system nitrogen regulatory IIA component